MPQVRPINQTGSSFTKGAGLSKSSGAPRGGSRTEKKLLKGELRLQPKAVKSFNKSSRAAAKANGVSVQNAKVSSSGFKAGNKSISKRQPSVAVKSNTSKAVSNSKLTKIAKIDSAKSPKKYGVESNKIKVAATVKNKNSTHKVYTIPKNYKTDVIKKRTNPKSK